MRKVDRRLHNDCDGGQCCACDWDRTHEALSRDRRAWFDPSRSSAITTDEYVHILIENAVKEAIRDWTE